MTAALYARVSTSDQTGLCSLRESRLPKHVPPIEVRSNVIRALQAGQGNWTSFIGSFVSSMERAFWQEGH